MAKVKVFVTDGQTDKQTEGRMRFNVPMLSRKRGTKNAIDGMGSSCAVATDLFMFHLGTCKIHECIS